MHTWTDCHVHLVDFLAEQADVPDLVRAFAAAGVDRAVVTGLPVRKRWSVAEPRRPSYYLDGSDSVAYDSATDRSVLDLVPLLESTGDLQVAPLVCGFDPTDRLAVEHVERVWALSPRWAGVGELLLRHDDLTNLTQGETPVADHPALDDVLDFCAGRDVPVSVHHDSASRGRPSEHEYLPPFEAMLDKHSDVTVVWCHGGSSRGIRPHDQVGLVADLLSRYPRLVVDVSWVLLDQVVDGDGQVDPRWCELVVSRPDRFVLGSDAVASPGTVTDRARQVRGAPGGPARLRARPGRPRERFPSVVPVTCVSDPAVQV